MSEDRDLVAAEDAVWNRAVTSLRSSRHWQQWIKAVLILGGATASTIGGAMDGSLWPTSGNGVVTLKGLLVFAGGISAFLGGVLLLFAEDDVPQLLLDARRLTADARRFLTERDALSSAARQMEQFDKQRLFLLKAIELMLEAAERMPQGTDIVLVIDTMLDAGTNELEGAIGFQPGEKWAFSIFRAVSSTGAGEPDVMKRIAAAWADRSAQKVDGREWGRREGFTGVAWQRDEDVIESDATIPEIAAQYPIPRSKVRDTDRQRYVSVAVIPIRVGNDDAMWGTVTATSDRAGRWTRRARDPGEQGVMAVRMLAQLIASQVAHRQNFAARGI
jgi:hypothetical protein